MSAPLPPKRVLVVDRPTTSREQLVYVLGSDPELEIVGVAGDGEGAVTKALELRPDVITIDAHLPNVDGFDTTRRIMQECPTPIVIVLGNDGASEVARGVRAIEAGALALVRRPTTGNSEQECQSAHALVQTVKAMADVKVVRRWPRREGGSAIQTRNAAASGIVGQKLVVIGASTGGPDALREVLSQLPPDYRLPIVIVQHMARGFISGFASWLSSASGCQVQVAEDGMRLDSPGVYVAPDGFHIEVGEDLRMRLVTGPVEHGMCPSVSHLFRNIPVSLCASTTAILLTGMGKDGGRELKYLKDHGAFTIVQDQETAAVYGMPKEAIRHDAALMVLSSTQIGKTLCTLAEHPNVYARLTKDSEKR